MHKTLVLGTRNSNQTHETTRIRLVENEMAVLSKIYDDAYR